MNDTGAGMGTGFTRHGTIKADPEKVAAGAKYLMLAFEEYLKGEPQSATDSFMIAHNFHRAMIETIAHSWEPNIPTNQTYRMADMTWRKAMRELRE